MLSRCTLGLGAETNSDQSVQRLELLHGLGGVVDEGETSGLATTELGAETEDGDLILLGLVHGGQLVTELVLGDVGAAGVQDVTGGRQKMLVGKFHFARLRSCLPSSCHCRPAHHPPSLKKFVIRMKPKEIKSLLLPC